MLKAGQANSVPVMPVMSTETSEIPVLVNQLADAVNGLQQEFEKLRAKLNTVTREAVVKVETDRGGREIKTPLGTAIANQIYSLHALYDNFVDLRQDIEL
jgi:hypothetical protein